MMGFARVVCSIAIVAYRANKLVCVAGLSSEFPVEFPCCVVGSDSKPLVPGLRWNAEVSVGGTDAITVGGGVC